MYIYIYIYIYILSSTVCFVVSQLFSVARHAWSWDRNPPNSTLDLVSDRSANKRTTSVRELIIRYHVTTAFVCLHLIPYRILASSIHSKSLHYAKIPSPERSNPIWGSVYIVIHRQTVSLYLNSSVYIYIYIYIIFIRLWALHLSYIYVMALFYLLRSH